MDLLPQIEETKNLESEIVDEILPTKDDTEAAQGDEPVEAASEEEEIVEVIPKPKIPPTDVFKQKELKETAPIIKKVKRTRTMTPAAKEKLAQARLKAIETRKRNSQLRKEGKMKKPSEIKEDEKKAEIEAKRPVVNNIVHETKNITNNITSEDIERISLAATQKALDGYEKVRKERKEAKRIKKEQENHKAIVKDKINTALGYKYGDPNFFDSCF